MFCSFSAFVVLFGCFDSVSRGKVELPPLLSTPRHAIVHATPPRGFTSVGARVVHCVDVGLAVGGEQVLDDLDRLAEPARVHQRREPAETRLVHVRLALLHQHLFFCGEEKERKTKQEQEFVSVSTTKHAHVCVFKNQRLKNE